MPGCVEHYLTHIMRSRTPFLPELALVAVSDEGRIVGNIAYTRAVIRAGDGTESGVLCMGPIAVLPELQRRGVGRALIEYTKSLRRRA